MCATCHDLSISSCFTEPGAVDRYANGLPLSLSQSATVCVRIYYCVFIFEMTDVVIISEASWGTETADASGYGKAPAPSRGGLANYRTRPY